MAEKQLPVPERLAVLFIVCLFVFLSLVAKWNPHKGGQAAVLDSHATADYDIQVVVSGAVRHPGIYHVSKGLPVSDLVDLVEPLFGADLRSFPRGKITKPLSIRVAPAPSIYISVSGAVRSPGSYAVPDRLPARLLANYLPLTEDADIQALADRPLKDGDQVVVPRV